MSTRTATITIAGPRASARGQFFRVNVSGVMDEHGDVVEVRTTTREGKRVPLACNITDAAVIALQRAKDRAARPPLRPGTHTLALESADLEGLARVLRFRVVASTTHRIGGTVTVPAGCMHTTEALQFGTACGVSEVSSWSDLIGRPARVVVRRRSTSSGRPITTYTWEPAR